ncbi:MAG: hypothetical protein LBJ12_02655 [Oscillospiraceae bacterium]|jgi:hypothetical protein|nr:hypothetical protein [Oscillospiraceae bacterium]
MKYFTDDYKGDPIKDYWAVFERIKKHIDPTIVKVFSSGILHDSRIMSLSVADMQQTTDSDFRHDVLLEICNDTYGGIWKHVKVSKFFVKEIDFTKCGEMQYLYGEILRQKKRLIHNFTCWPLESEVYIECESMSWENIDC